MVDSSISSIRYKDISDDKAEIAVTKLKCPATLIRKRQLTSSSRNTVSRSSALTKKTLSVAMRISNADCSLVAIAPARPIPRTGRVI